jgi:hypothetical protein
MPNVLVKGGIASAVEMMIGKLEKSEKMQIDFVCTEKFPRFCLNWKLSFIESFKSL